MQGSTVATVVQVVRMAGMADVEQEQQAWLDACLWHVSGESANERHDLQMSGWRSGDTSMAWAQMSLSVGRRPGRRGGSRG